MCGRGAAPGRLGVAGFDGGARLVGIHDDTSGRAAAGGDVGEKQGESGGQADDHANPGPLEVDGQGGRAADLAGGGGFDAAGD